MRCLAAVPDARARATLALLRRVAGDQGFIPLKVALPALAAECQHDGARWLFRQLVWCVGFWLDEFFGRRFRDLSEMPLAKQSCTAGHKGIIKYWLGIVGTFKDPSCLHIAVDGSTLLKRSVVTGMIALPDGTGAVFPPQAIWGALP